MYVCMYICRNGYWPLEISSLLTLIKLSNYFGSRAMISKVEDFRLTLLGKKITPTASAKDLGVILDSCLT